LLLSICIPTYNRATLLQEALESIAGQIDESMINKVEIVVSDNASTDETFVVVNRLKQATRVLLSYFKNESNVGFDQNILLLVERARGRYVWILGDDDLLAAGALAKVVNVLEGANEIAVFLGEKEDFYLSTDRPMRWRKIMNSTVPVVYDFSQPGKLDEYFRTNKKLIAFLNFISIIVFKRSSWLAVKNKEGYVGTGYIHVYVLQKILWSKPCHSLKYLPFAMARRRWGTDPNYDPEVRLKQDFEMFHRIATAVFDEPKYIWQIDDLVIRSDGFSWAARAKLKSPWRFFVVHLPILMKRYYSHPLFWLKIFPLVFVPSFIVRLLRYSYRRIVKGEALGWQEFAQ